MKFCPHCGKELALGKEKKGKQSSREIADKLHYFLTGEKD